MRFGDNLKEELHRKKLRQKEFAEILQIPPTTLNGYLTNRREPNLLTLKKIANQLEVSVDSLLEDVK